MTQILNLRVRFSLIQLHSHQLHDKHFRFFFPLQISQVNNLQYTYETEKLKF